MHYHGSRSGVFHAACEQHEFEVYMAADVDCEVPRTKFCDYSILK